MDIFISLFFFLVYSTFILYFGKYGLGQSSHLRTFFVANNSLGLWASIFTFCATWISMTSLLAITGAFYLEGITPLFSVILGWLLGASLLLLIVNKLRKYDLLTIPQFFAKRYQSKLLQVLAGFVNICIHLIYMVIQIYGFGLILSYLLDIPYLLAISMVYLFLIYTTFGGLHSIARTDKLNFYWIILSILSLAIWLAWKLIEKGEFASYAGQVLTFNPLLLPASREFTSSLDILSFLSVSIIWICGKATHTQYLIRVVSAKSAQTATKMIWVSILILSVFYLIIAFIGTSSGYLITEYVDQNPNEIILLIIRDISNSYLTSFIFLGFLASSISTANSQLLIFTSSFSYDVLNILFKQRINEQHLGVINRFLILGGASCAFLLSITPPSTLLGTGSYIWGILACTFFWPFYGGLLWKRATTKGAYAAMFVGLISCLLFTYYDTYYQQSQVHPAIYGLVFSGILFFGVSLYSTQNGKIDNEGT